MLSVTFKPFTLNVVMLIVVAPSILFKNDCKTQLPSPKPVKLKKIANFVTTVSYTHKKFMSLATERSNVSTNG
jgi:hypothetical protein